jgi:hypothetical protein
MLCLGRVATIRQPQRQRGWWWYPSNFLRREDSVGNRNESRFYQFNPAAISISNSDDIQPSGEAVNDAMVGKYTSEEWRSRAYAVRYFVGFTAAGASVGLVAWLYQQGSFVTMLHAFAGAVPAGDRGGDHPADRNQGAGGGRELIAPSPSPACGGGLGWGLFIQSRRQTGRS